MSKELYFPAIARYFRDAFYPSPLSLASPQEIAARLLLLIQERPLWDSVEGLAEFVVTLAHEHPEDVATFVQALHTLQCDPATSCVKIEWDEGEIVPFDALFVYHLDDYISAALADNDLDRVITKRNDPTLASPPRSSLHPRSSTACSR